MSEDQWSSFGEALGACLAKLDMSQTELARRAGLQPKSINALVTGPNQTPQRRNLIRILDELRKAGLDDGDLTELERLGRSRRRRTTLDPPENRGSPPQTAGNIERDAAQSERDAAQSPPLHGLVALIDDRRQKRRSIFLILSLLGLLGMPFALLLVAVQWQATGYESIVLFAADETFCPGASALCQTAQGSVQGSVHMVCWQDAIALDGQKNRWFYIQGSDGTEGFVRAGSVTKQINTPNCSRISWINAAAWALSLDGQTVLPQSATEGENEINPPSGSWLFSYNAWKLGGGHTPVHSASSAQQTWNQYKADGRWQPPSRMCPRGSPVFLSDGSMGQVAISLGNGWVEIAQGASRSGRLSVTHMTLAQIGLSQLGYVPPNQV